MIRFHDNRLSSQLRRLCCAHAGKRTTTWEHRSQRAPIRWLGNPQYGQLDVSGSLDQGIVVRQAGLADVERSRSNHIRHQCSLRFAHRIRRWFRGERQSRAFHGLRRRPERIAW